VEEMIRKEEQKEDAGKAGVERTKK